MGRVFYNDNTEYVCKILDQTIEEGNIPDGDIYWGDIQNISGTTFKNYTSWHLFAGIGGMPAGLRMGGWPDEWPILTAGFPCQPVSNAGKRLAQADPRWLWPEAVRVLRVVRPPVILLENTPGLLSRGMDDVLRDLAESGYHARWRVLAAADVGAPHLRERVWIVAYPNSARHEAKRQIREWVAETVGGSGTMADTAHQRDVWGDGSLRENAESARRWDHHRDRAQANDGREWWAAEPDVGRVVDGLPNRVDRIKALGNAVVPQVVAALVPWIVEGMPDD